MSTGLVSALHLWIDGHSAGLKQSGIEIETRFPDHSSPAPWKASVEFVFNDILVTYTVWERTIFQTSLIVFNMKEKQTVFFKDAEPEAVDVIDAELADVVEKLTSGAYGKMSTSA
jgi:hypothetical protein